MRAFLLYIGAYNAIGSFALLLFLSKAKAQLILGKYLQILAEPYDHGTNGPLWISWAMMSNLGLGAAMVLASRWPYPDAQRDIAVVAVGVYVLGLGVAGLGLRSPRYRKSGLIACIVLWIAQIAWGLYGITA